MLLKSSDSLMRTFHFEISVHKANRVLGFIGCFLHGLWLLVFLIFLNALTIEFESERLPAHSLVAHGEFLTQLTLHDPMRLTKR